MFKSLVLSPPSSNGPQSTSKSRVGGNYIDLNNTKLEVRAKLTMPDGTDIAGGTHVGVVNLPLHSMFELVTIKIADKVVTETNNMYPYRALMETLLN